MVLKRFLTIGFKLGLCLTLITLPSFRSHAQSATPDKEAERINRIVQVMSEIPTFPTFEDAESSYRSGDNFEEVANYFYSTSSYGDVKSFYIRRLNKKRWKLVAESTGEIKRLVFRKGGYSVTIALLNTTSEGKAKYSIAVHRSDRDGSAVTERRT